MSPATAPCAQGEGQRSVASWLPPEWEREGAGGDQEPAAEPLVRYEAGASPVELNAGIN